MNINPSDTDVRQGYSLAGSAAAQAASPTPAQVRQDAAPGLAPEDEHSASIAAAADRTTVKETAEKLGRQLEENGTGLKIRVLDDNHSSVQVEVVDGRTNRVLRKIPQDDMLKLSASIKEMSGVLMNRPA